MGRRTDTYAFFYIISKHNTNGLMWAKLGVFVGKILEMKRRIFLLLCLLSVLLVDARNYLTFVDLPVATVQADGISITGWNETPMKGDIEFAVETYYDRISFYGGGSFPALRMTIAYESYHGQLECTWWFRSPRTDASLYTNSNLFVLQGMVVEEGNGRSYRAFLLGGYRQWSQLHM